jgi:hypothetical protein
LKKRNSAGLIVVKPQIPDKFRRMTVEDPSSRSSQEDIMSSIFGHAVSVAVIGYLPPGINFADISTDSATDSASIFRSPLAASVASSIQFLSHPPAPAARTQVSLDARLFLRIDSERQLNLSGTRKGVCNDAGGRVGSPTCDERGGVSKTKICMMIT